MKKLAPLFLAISVIFASCSSNENAILDNGNQEKLLQSYTLKRDASGAYSIDFKTTENTDVTTIENTDKTNEIILSEVNHKTASKHSNNFSIENDQLKIGFLEANRGKRSQIFVEDDNITFAKGGVTEFLNSYSITKNNDGTFLLNFKVNNNVATEFTYNEELETYEVHLSNGAAKQKEFSRELKLNTNDFLKLDFVNYKYSEKAEVSSYRPRKPRVVILNGSDIL
ncbi:hypothetical protein BA195_09125 [Tenacibaculum soleae]|uniref:Lipoprotein n=1 Tax=Tenacibaculum soleae TaxID=447689 RepID=A0A1B9XZS4_9FLAO|nr:hypothetical protein [Tenacibaculum soleae]OCK43043.1 hypothetical protein BA195_09125 [Tenacibaculum soleae]